jgi:hypothetical protein
MSSTTAERTPVNTAAIGVDAALVVLFATIGYWTHADELSLGGVASTAWPFLLALGVAHLLLAALGRPAASLLGGVAVWLVTVAGGMGVRQFAGDGTATAFVVVATAFNAATLLGWRLVALLVRRG